MTSIFYTYIWAFRTTIKSLFRDAKNIILSILLTGLGLTIPLFTGSLFWSISEPLRTIQPNIEITAFTEQNYNKKLLDDIRVLPHIRSVRCIQKKRVFQQLNDSLGIKNKNFRNPFPDVLVITLKPNLSNETIVATATQIEKLNGIDLISYETSWFRRLQGLTNLTQKILLSLGGLIGLFVIFVLLTAMRLTTYSATQEIKNIYLLGGSPLFAIRPWAWRGFIVLTLGASISILLSSLTIYFLQIPLQNLNTIFQSNIQFSLIDTYFLVYYILLCGVIGSVITAMNAWHIWQKNSRI